MALALLLAVGKPAVLLALALVMMSLPLAAFAPLSGALFVDLGLWLTGTVGLCVGLAMAALRGHRGDTERLSDALYALLAVFGAGSFAVALLLSARAPSNSSREQALVVGVGAVSALLAVKGLVDLVKLLRSAR
jgi:hypothetical protein